MLSDISLLFCQVRSPYITTLWMADISLGSFVKWGKLIYLVIWLCACASHHKQQTLTPDCLFERHDVNECHERKHLVAVPIP